MIANLPEARELSSADAHDMLRAAYFGGKNLNNPHARYVPVRDGDGPWVLVQMPLQWIHPNEDGEQYDGTVNPDRAAQYAATPHIDSPVHLAFGARMVRRGRTTAAVLDGGHRTSAARLRGDTTLPALMQQSHFDLLAGVRVAQAAASPALTPSDALAPQF